jgi:hypothetical protein
MFFKDRVKSFLSDDFLKLFPNHSFIIKHIWQRKLHVKIFVQAMVLPYDHNSAVYLTQLLSIKFPEKMLLNVNI